MTLSQLQQAVLFLFPASVYMTNWTPSVDSQGNATINLWNNTLGTQPTSDQLTAALATSLLKAAQTAQVGVVTASYTASGYAPVAYMSTTFPSDPNTLLLLSCTILQGGTPQGLPTGFQWWDVNGAGVAMTLVQLQGLGNAIFAQVYAAYAKLQSLIAQIESATTVATVQAVVWS